MPRKRIEILPGTKINRWTFIEDITTESKKHPKCILKCSCGTIKTVRRHSFLSGESKSCGCLLTDVLIKRNTTHNMGKTRFFVIWRNMMRRCYNEKDQAYSHYGGRGIYVQERWHTFENFIEDTLSSYKENFVIDRINNEKGYTFDNCRWVSNTLSSFNRTSVLNQTSGLEKINKSTYRVRVNCFNRNIFRKCFKNKDEAQKVRNYIVKNLLEKLESSDEHVSYFKNTVEPAHTCSKT